jgi:Bacteriophage CI repressor helix-turn-helix domain
LSYNYYMVINNQNNSKNSGMKENQQDRREGSEQNGFARNQFEAQFKRIKESLQVSSETALAKLLGIKQPSIAKARKRKKIPPGWITRISEQYGISADWILFGIGDMRALSRKPSMQIKPIKAGLNGMLEALHDFPDYELEQTYNWATYRKFANQFVDDAIKEAGYQPWAGIVNGLKALVDDEISLKLKARIIDYINMTKRMDMVNKNKP